MFLYIVQQEVVFLCDGQTDHLNGCEWSVARAGSRIVDCSNYIHTARHFTEHGVFRMST